MVKTSTAEKNNHICPACGDELRQDPSGRGFVRHVSNPRCGFERGLKDHVPAVEPQSQSSPGKGARPAAGTLSPGKAVRQKQHAWALAQGITIDDSDYTLTLDDNLFVPLSGASRAEFAQGDGGELGTPGKRGKMQALHSSSALACNVFEHWRGRDASSLVGALHLPGSIDSIDFERKFPTGLPGNAPNLDVVLGLSDKSIVAIESKFLEPYGRPHPSGFKAKYFESDVGRWTRCGYAHCQELAERLNSGETVFRWLHAEQLLKHILGLANSGLRWELLYLWYEPPGPAGVEHAAEAAVFADAVSKDGIRFRAMTYQQLFSAIQDSCEGSDRSYVSYLGARYFQ